MESSNSTVQPISGVFATGINIRYVQGMVDADQHPYLITNLIEGKTLALHQPQKMWTIGRGRDRVALWLKDKQLSRYHAVIQYVDYQGFFLVDLGSTNGSHVNGQPIQGRVFLRDGDRISIGSVDFTFFQQQDVRQAILVPPEIVDQVKSLEPVMTLLPERTSASDLSDDYDDDDDDQ